MSSAMEQWVNDIHVGDAAATLREMPANSVHMAMCSPPYYGLRDYGADGQIGLEATLNEYIQSLVAVGDELKRVLRPDGSWWLNLGDSYANTPTGSQPDGEWSRPSRDESQARKERGMPEQFGRKQKMLVPHRVAIALQDAGWVVRSDAVWAKPNAMPEAVKDRLSETKEYVFHLTPARDYWFDLDAIREPHKPQSINRAQRDDNRHEHSRRQSVHNEETLNPEQFVHPNGKNPGDVFDVTVRPFPEAHFAVYPPELCERPIKASCPPRVCSACGTPYEREAEEKRLWEQDIEDVDRPQARRALELAEQHGVTDEHMAAARAVNIGDTDGSNGNPYDRVDDESERLAREVEDALGAYYREFAIAGTQKGESHWRQACDCATDATEPGIVLDPFAGAGTTCLVAKRLARRFVGVDLNPDYVALAQQRVGVTVDEPERLVEDGQTTLQRAADGGRRP